jgi:hypothetical protein
MPRLRSAHRLASALAAALVLWASLASAGHAHASAAPRPAGIDASAVPSEPAAAGELECALCAAASRIAAGEPRPYGPPLDAALLRFHAPHAGDVAPPRPLLARGESRAPPRLG